MVGLNTCSVYSADFRHICWESFTSPLSHWWSLLLLCSRFCFWNLCQHHFVDAAFTPPQYCFPFVIFSWFFCFCFSFFCIQFVLFYSHSRCVQSYDFLTFTLCKRFDHLQTLFSMSSLDYGDFLNSFKYIALFKIGFSIFTLWCCLFFLLFLFLVFS